MIAENVQGEQQQKLDVIANEILLRTLGGREGVAIVASEENEEPVILRTRSSGERKYCVLFDPLDGSSNLDVCGARGHHLQHPAPRPARHAGAGLAAAAGHRSRSRPATCSTAPRRCSC
jgi:hypothetical protein